MPLPAALLAKLKNRGIIQESGALATTKPEAEKQDDSPLPPNWKVVIDKSSSKTYYWNVQTGTTVWKRPKAAASDSPASTAVTATTAQDVDNAKDEVVKSNSHTIGPHHPSAARDEPDDDADEDMQKHPRELTAEDLPYETPMPTIAPSTASAAAAVDNESSAPVEAIVHETCWKCGKKNPLPEGICIKCKGKQNKPKPAQQPMVLQRPMHGHMHHAPPPMHGQMHHAPPPMHGLMHHAPPPMHGHMHHAPPPMHGLMHHAPPPMHGHMQPAPQAPRAAGPPSHPGPPIPPPQRPPQGGAAPFPPHQPPPHRYMPPMPPSQHTNPAPPPPPTGTSAPPGKPPVPPPTHLQQQRPPMRPLPGSSHPPPQPQHTHARPPLPPPTQQPHTHTRPPLPPPTQQPHTHERPPLPPPTQHRTPPHLVPAYQQHTHATPPGRPSQHVHVPPAPRVPHGAPQPHYGRGPLPPPTHHALAQQPSPAKRQKHYHPAAAGSDAGAGNADPMDPSSYSDTSMGGWSAGLAKDTPL